jgi:hypothetical protein
MTSLCSAAAQRDPVRPPPGDDTSSLTDGSAAHHRTGTGLNQDAASVRNSGIRAADDSHELRSSRDCASGLVLESLERRAFVAGIESDVPVTAIRSDISRDDQDAAHLSEDAKEEESFQDGRVNKKQTST